MAEYKFVKSYDEVGNIRTFVFEANGVSWVPGQYQTWELPAVGGGEDDHLRFFTIAAAPSENELHISTRVSDSKFKRALNALQPGDAIVGHDLEGDFTWDDDQAVVLVAGGIGVTPYRAMLVERAATNRPIKAHLLYFGRDDNFAFKGEFDKIADEYPELKIDYIVGELITADNIVSHAPETKNQTTYLSGPEPMVEAVGEDLKKQGINLKQDWFPGYDEHTY